MREIEAEASRAQQGGGFDIDAVTDADLTEPPRPPPALTMDDLERVIASPHLLPPGIEVTPMGRREYDFRQPDLAEAVRVATAPVYYEQNADSVELWSRESPLSHAGGRGRCPTRPDPFRSAGVRPSYHRPPFRLTGGEGGR